MEAILTDGAARLIKGLLLAGGAPEGFLFGHAQGGTFFITDVLPTRLALLSQEKIRAVDKLYKNRLLGFFFMGEDEKKRRKFLAPWACGKILISVLPGERGAAELKASKVEYEQVFFLKEIGINSPL